ncbi:unnamed protein product [Thelazia callipaeda]|uniref:IFT81_CH domain-containing protein n=1 Tax=Thelazia callipaeda TaxID=103827 RepID=A0A0N5DBS2_THECL|nr:unnamed protein product [Thelazia callipaeda]
MIKSDECIIRKLVADGDGSGDDRRFVTILTLLFKLMKEPELAQSLLPRILKMLDATEIAMQKQVSIGSMNKQQIENYIAMVKKIDDDLLKANDSLLAAKKELSVVKGMRRNKEEYEMMAKIIEKIPSRSETNKYYEENNESTNEGLVRTEFDTKKEKA